MTFSEPKVIGGQQDSENMNNRERNKSSSTTSRFPCPELKISWDSILVTAA
jgi:hypothetical protein